MMTMQHLMEGADLHIEFLCDQGTPFHQPALADPLLHHCQVPGQLGLVPGPVCGCILKHLQQPTSQVGSDGWYSPV